MEISNISVIRNKGDSEVIRTLSNRLDSSVCACVCVCTHMGIHSFRNQVSDTLLHVSDWAVAEGAKINNAYRYL